MSNKEEECDYDMGLTGEEMDALSWLNTVLGQWSRLCDPRAEGFHIAQVAMAKILKKFNDNHDLLHEKDHELMESELATVGLLGLSLTARGNGSLN